MIPVLYPENETEFANNGLGRLGDATSCIVEEERNGKYELQLQYPVSGKRFQDIKHSRIIYAMPFDAATPQPFRIYYISKPIDGMITVRAEHISYHLSHIPVSPFTATACAEALQGLQTNAAEACPFSFWTDKTTAANFSVQAPSSIRSMLGGVRGSILDVYGGEYEFDKYTVKLHSSRGINRGVTLRYGKNITDVTQEESIEKTITGVYPFWKSTDASGTGRIVELDEKVLHSANAVNFPFQRTVPLDLSSEFGETAPTQAELRARAQTYMQANNVGVPSVSIKVSFTPLWQTEEYKAAANLERVRLCDTVAVQFQALDITAAAKVVRTKFNTLTERYEEIELGDARSNLGATLKNNIDAAGDGALQALRESSSALKKEIARNTARITGADGGSIQFLFDTNGNPTAIAALNTDSVDTATECLIINYAGLGGSQNGIAGPFISAITSDGHINADVITVGHMLATMIRGGVLSLGGTESANSFGNGVMQVYDANDNLIGQWDRNGLTASGDLTMVKSDQKSGLGTAKYANYLQVEGQVRWGDKTGFYAKKLLNGETVSSFAFFPESQSITEQVYTSGTWQKTFVFAENGTTKGTVYFLKATKTGFTLKPYPYGGADTSNCIEANLDGSGLRVYSQKALAEVNDNGINILSTTGKVLTSEYYVRITNGANVSAAKQSYLEAGGVYAESRGIHGKAGDNGLSIFGGGTNQAHIGMNAGTVTFAVDRTYAKANGNNLAYASSSSRRYKHDIEHELTKDRDPHNLLKIAPAQFVFNEDHKLQYPDMFGKTVPGLIAEEVAEAYPSAAICNPETGEIESWDERRIIPGMLALIQEQEKRIKDLESRLAKLEGTMNV